LFSNAVQLQKLLTSNEYDNELRVGWNLGGGGGGGLFQCNIPALVWRGK
jgi:hypothetical protein